MFLGLGVQAGSQHHRKDIQMRDYLYGIALGIVSAYAMFALLMIGLNA